LAGEWIVRRLLPLGVLVFVFGILPAVLSALGQGYLFRLAELTMIFVILATSLNLLTGTAGLVSLGHAAFYAVGAYTASIVSLRFGTGLEVSLPASALVTGLIALIVAVPAIRLVRIFFTVATLSVGEIIRIVITNWDGLTRGPMGLRGIAPASLFGLDLGGRLGTFYTIAVVSTGATWIVWRLTHSYYGGALRAVREDDQSAGAMGVNVGRLKLGVCTISGALAGVAGCLLAHSTGFISPDMFGIDESILILTMVVVGGLGSVPGAVLGAALLILVPEISREAGHFRMVFVGLVLYLSILLRPTGILAEAVSLRFARGTEKPPGDHHLAASMGRIARYRSPAS
jgi:branched-chain amino acid transport system permease protein